jgi:dodecin
VFVLFDILIYTLISVTYEMTHVAKVIEIIGGSDKGWSEAAQVAIDEAKKTIHGITGLEVNDMTAKVDPNTGNITEYRVAVKIAFGVEHSQ